MADQNNKQPKISERNWLKILLILTGLVIIISIIFNVLFQENVPVQYNTWNNLVTPGYKFSKAAQDQLGKPIEVKSTDLGTQYSYQSVFPIHPNNVTITGDDVVKFVEEFIDYDPNHTLEQYTSQYGEPDLILFYPQAGDGTLANVFLSQGLVVFTHRYAGTVQQKWYFEPISQEEFLTTFGKNLTTQESGPEAFQ